MHSAPESPYFFFAAAGCLAITKAAIFLYVASGMMFLLTSSFFAL
jgi:hypothetical protein